MTIGRVFDYICDVIACSPENLRKPKTKELIEEDERRSRLTSPYYGHDLTEDPEYALLLWNDEKHTVNEVRDQVARACKIRLADALQKAHDVDDVGRAIVKYDHDIDVLLEAAKIIEHIKVTVTIRSSRDTFREQMCGTMIEWLSDIAGCSVGADHNILGHIVCEEMLQKWRTGSEAQNAEVGRDGLDDHEMEDRENEEARWARQVLVLQAARRAAQEANSDDESDAEDEIDADDVDEDDFDAPDDIFEVEEVVDVIMAGNDAEFDNDGDIEMGDDALEAQEATIAGYPAPPPPPPQPNQPGTQLQQRASRPRTRSENSFNAAYRSHRERDTTPSDSDTAEPLIQPRVYAKVNMDIPRTPGPTAVAPKCVRMPPKYWLQTPDAYQEKDNIPLHEDLFQRVRLDWMILFDLRMWKKVRIDLRDLYISTVVSIPQFKRVLGLRFAGLYTLLAQLYLIADREPDHSIINISLQMLTTPSITMEIVERGNFLTNLMAILYTFLTTRQVNHPFHVEANETLNFEAGSVTNRRMYHFFMDLRYLFGSEHVQERLRTEERYTMQFLDLVKLHQGICPNVRAVGEHVEYETDHWISASLITREINRLCRQFAESFKWHEGQDITSIANAIRFTAKTVIRNSLGLDRKRFKAAEITDEVQFKLVSDYEFEAGDPKFRVVDFVVDKLPISFHHALHYTLSWLIEGAKSMPREHLRQLLTFAKDDLDAKPRAMGVRSRLSDEIAQLAPEDYLLAAFDYPLRVCAWLAQMKAGAWVRNGMSLRHQAGTYRGVSQRDVSHHRDIFLLQTAMVICDPSRVLASMVDRYGMEYWMKGIFEQRSQVMDDGQQLDVVEDMIHLLIVILSDRTSLVSTEEQPDPHVLAMRRDITHVLCFKPLSFTEICAKLPEKFQEQEECQDILDEMTTFKAPEGLSDVGTFELKERFMEDLDPYIAHYNKNQREESENAYRAWAAKKIGKPVDSIVFEPKLRPIESGVFADLAGFTRTGMFAQIIYYSVMFCLSAVGPLKLDPQLPATRLETFMQVVLHLVLIAVAEDRVEEDEMSRPSEDSFVYKALNHSARTTLLGESPNAKTIVSLLEIMSSREEFKACQPKVQLVLKRMRQKRPNDFDSASIRLGLSVDRVDTASPAVSNPDEDRQKRKLAALERQKRVMAQFQEQQKTFMDNQGDVDWGDEDMSDNDLEVSTEERKNFWKYPAGTCILCQEETNESRPYGTFAMLSKSRILRQTDFTDEDFVREVIESPANLDESADAIRPYGVSGNNKIAIIKVDAHGDEVEAERQTIGKGFPFGMCRNSTVSVGCGHIMHYKCFELYFEASRRRHAHQIARQHPERLSHNEFVCPLCKAQGNAFLPIIWKGKEEVYPGCLQLNLDFEQWLGSELPSEVLRVRESPDTVSNGWCSEARYQELFEKHNADSVVSPMAAKLYQMRSEAWQASSTTPTTTNVPIGSARLLPANTPGAFPHEHGDIHGAMSGNLSGQADSAMLELVHVYRRLAQTMKLNHLRTNHHYDDDQDKGNDLYSSDTLAEALGTSISTVEIQQRGIASSYGATLLETTPQQNLTHLRILGETALSYVAIGGQKFDGKNRVAAEYAKDCDLQFDQMFIGHPKILPVENSNLPLHFMRLRSLLAEDIFLFLTKASLCLSPVLNIDIMNLVQLCCIAEIVKVIMLINRHASADELNLISNSTEASPFQHFFKHVIDADNQARPLLQGSSDGVKGSISLDSPAACERFIERYVQVFLRKCVLLLHVRYGVDFNLHSASNPGADEVTRLVEALRLRPLHDLYAAISSSGPISEGIGCLRSMIAGWTEHYAPRDLESRRLKPAEPPSLSVSHPVIYELIGLPLHYHTLMEETMKRRCPTTGKDVSDPMLCLFCGDIFCAQSICCLKEEPAVPGRKSAQIGGAQQHMRK